MSSNGRAPEKKVLVLQGGGAMGAYQGGSYEALSAGGCTPDWIAGISIGAINGAIIAGNPPEKRVEKLRQFWELVSSRLPFPPLGVTDYTRKLFNEASAALVASTGVPGFFELRVPPAVVMPPGTPEAISIYDTSPLHATLLELVDRVLVVDCPVPLQLERLIRRDGLPRDEALAMIAAPTDRATRLRAAHDVIDNSGDPEHTRRQVAQLHQRYLELAKRPMRARTD